MSFQPIVNILSQQFQIPIERLQDLHTTLEAQHDWEAWKGALIKQKVASESQLQQALARYYDLEYCDEFLDVELPERFTENVLIKHLKNGMCCPFARGEMGWKFAIEDPARTEMLDDLSRRLQIRIQPVISQRQAIIDLIHRIYDKTSAATEEAIDNLDAEESFESILSVEEPEDLLESSDEEPIKRLVNSLLWQAAKDEASDVHIDPNPKATVVRYRVDGVLHQVTALPRPVHLTVVNRVKVMSRLDIAQKGLPQDGRTMVLIAGKKIDIRVSTIPTVHGEKIVMRLLYQNTGLMRLNELGIREEILRPLRTMIHKTGGIILVTGPTGSGKTTTLYASLGEIDSQARNVITIEDPVEYKIASYSQIEVNAKLGLSFARALRSVLRQDPDVVMVGEMRDTETAQIAIQAALTGHLVFSTVHTNSAPATITRLIDMGVEPFLVSSTIIGVLAQRLVRRICSSCKLEYQPHPEQLRELGISAEPSASFFRGSGCEDCRGTGYRGRVGLHELLTMNENIKDAILRTSDANEIKRVGLKTGLVTLRMDGIQKIRQGLTTVEEVLAITTEDYAPVEIATPESATV
jgi:general secretion pathway protein E